jgi:hypothetical protein
MTGLVAEDYCVVCITGILLNVIVVSNQLALVDECLDYNLGYVIYVWNSDVVSHQLVPVDKCINYNQYQWMNGSTTIMDILCVKKEFCFSSPKRL